jgi:hypothetical protein
MSQASSDSVDIPQHRPPQWQINYWRTKIFAHRMYVDTSSVPKQINTINTGKYIKIK